MIRFEQVSKTYPGGHQALSHVDFHIQPGEMAFLTGHSGAGKSTLLKLISIMERPTAGRVMINGNDLRKIKSSQVPYVRRDIGMIFQDHRLLMDKSVFDNVALPLIIEGYRVQEARKRVLAWRTSIATTHRCYRVVNKNASGLPGLSLINRRYCLPMSQQVTSIPNYRWKSFVYLSRSTKWAWQS